MESCRRMSSSLQRPSYITWRVESRTPVAAAEERPPLSHQPAAPGSIPLLLLTPPETSGGQTNTAVPPQSPQSAFTQGSTRSRRSQLNPREDDGGEKGRKESFRLPEKEGKGKDLHEGPEDESFFLPRSSPVISRSFRPLSWHGGDTSRSALSGLDSPSRSLSLDQRGCLRVKSVEHLESESSSRLHSELQEDKKLHRVSASSGLSRLLSSGLDLLLSGQQGLTGGHRGQGRTCCEAPPSPAQDSKDRRFSGIPQLPADICKTSCCLEKENAHFIVVDMVLEVLEGVKWTLSCDRWTHTQHTHCELCALTHTGTAEDVNEHTQKHTHTCNTADPKPDKDVTSSHANTHQHTQHEDEEQTGNQPKTFSVLSTDSGFEDCGADSTLTPRDSLRNVEWLAQQLVLGFRRSWLPSHEPRRGRQSLRSSLQELPGTGCMEVSSSTLTEEIRLRTRMRGSLSWAPPRFQIIFTVHPNHRRSDVVALQHFLCAGCGTKVEPKYTKKLRYCEYLGRYFCECCHSGSDAVIPGRVLSCWDFGRYPVSDFSKRLLDSTWTQPLFDLSCVGKTLYSRVKELDKFRELQEQLLGIRKLLGACRLSGRVFAEFEQLPAHVLEQPHLFSMDDLLKVKRGQLVVQARALLLSALCHVENCKLCLARGFICEFCRGKDIIFPFQSLICQRCPVCRACFHKHCFEEKKCPKCARIQSRNKRPDGS